MPHPHRDTTKRGFLTTVLCLVLLNSVGCGALPHMMYWMHGVPVAAKYEGLRDKRVAVVCVANENSFGDSGVSEGLARLVARHLRGEVKGIDVIHENEVAQWIDDTGWDRVSYPEVGKGVKADMVVAIDLARFKVDAGSHLYQGVADYTIKVFDMTDGGQLVYRREEEEFLFPRGGNPVSGKSSNSFRRMFVEILAEDIAKDFFEYQMTEDFAKDAAYMGQ